MADVDISFLRRCVDSISVGISELVSGGFVQFFVVFVESRLPMSRKKTSKPAGSQAIKYDEAGQQSKK